MIGATERIAVPLAVLVIVTVTSACGGGSGNATLTISNEQSSGAKLDITQVLTRPCVQRYWSPDDPPLDSTRDLPAEGKVTIAFGETRSFDLVPGCHDFVVKRDGGTARARVVLDEGEAATWIPFQIEDNTSWWCGRGEACK
jgi:hypothetical protein